MAAMMRWPLLLASTLFAALFLAWQALVTVNFLYPFWHRVLDIGDTVRIYGPQNRNRSGFERTSAAEQARLFAAIVRAVENDGRGLEQLEYHDPQGRPLGHLLTAPEIVHLRDVARLIAHVERFGWSCLAAFLLLALSLWFRPAPRPPLKRTLAAVATTFIVAVATVLLIGPKTVFYTLHTWIFPAGHPWFFYYQDSLMTTLMQAPNLFAGIAAELLLLTTGLFALLMALAARLLPRR
jgi:hypothetical protein